MVLRSALAAHGRGRGLRLKFHRHMAEFPFRFKHLA